MSITGNLNVFPFSLTGLQNFDGTINGSTPVDAITIAGQTTFLSSTAVDVNGDVVLDLHIPDASATATGLLTSVDWTTFNNKAGKGENNIYTGTNQFNSNVLITSSIIQFTNLGSTVETHYIAYNPSTGLITYNPVINLLTTSNIFFGTQDFSNTSMKMSLSSATTGFHLGYNPTTRAVTFNSDASSSLLGTNNLFTGTNEYSNVNIRFSGLTTSSDTSFLRINLSTGQISTSLISSLSILGLANTFTNTNTFSSYLYLNTANTFGLYMPASTVMRIGFNNGLASPPTTNAFMDFNNAGGSALYGNGSFTLEVAKTVLGSSSVMFLNDRSLYLRGSTDTNHYLKYDGTNIDGWQLAGYIGGGYGSTFTGGYKIMLQYDGSNNVHYESNGDTMAYLVRNGITDLKWVVFRTPTSYAYYNTLSNTLGTTSDERTKKDIQAIDTNKSKEFILSITPSTFRFRDGNTVVKNIGFIAQDILRCSKTEAQKNIVSNWKIYEDAVAKGEEAYEDYKDGNGIMKKRKVMLGVSAMSIIPELVGCIQSQNREIISLHERLLKIEKLLDLK